jgi:RNA polymerase sigma-70 factor, ECF subfamily
LQRSLEMIVREAQCGREAAFAELILRHEAIALTVAYGITSDADLAGDVVQESFVRAWQKLGQLREPERFQSWLIGIVRNLALGHCRSRQRRGLERLDAEPVDRQMTDDPVAAAQAGEHREQLMAAMQELDEVSRIVLMLRYFQDIPSQQIAELLEMSISAVDTRICRARQSLRERLEMLKVPDNRW